MYTECPQCHSVFRVRAEHLRAAGGRVRCGTCATEFDAVAGLRDERYVARALGERGAEDAVPGADDTRPGASPVPAAADAATRSATTRPVLDDEVAATDPAVGDAADELAVPEALREDLARIGLGRRARRRRAAGMVAALALVAGLAAQVAWFHTDAVWRMYPQARGALQSFCTATGCRLPNRRDPAAMRVVSREVRVHPRYEGALELMAVIANTASYAQALPGVQFTLFNVNGQVIATRAFSPADYLDAGASPNAPLAPDRPLQIALEMVAPEEAAVSYELRFF